LPSALRAIDLSAELGHRDDAIVTSGQNIDRKAAELQMAALG
jgi:hypothetical protein